MVEAGDRVWPETKSMSTSRDKPRRRGEAMDLLCTQLAAQVYRPVARRAHSTHIGEVSSDVHRIKPHGIIF